MGSRNFRRTFLRTEQDKMKKEALLSEWHSGDELGQARPHVSVMARPVREDDVTIHRLKTSPPLSPLLLLSPVFPGDTS